MSVRDILTNILFRDTKGGQTLESIDIKSDTTVLMLNLLLTHLLVHDLHLHVMAKPLIQTHTRKMQKMPVKSAPLCGVRHSLKTA